MGYTRAKGAAIDMMSVLTQFNVSDDPEFADELDDAIGFDELEELDSIADSEEIRYDDDSDIFGMSGIFSDPDDMSEDDLSMFSLIEEVS